MENKESINKFSFAVFGEMVKNSIRISKIIWAENKIAVIALVLAFLFVSATPFVQSGASALLINTLVRTGIAGVNTSQILFLVGIIVLASFIPAVFRIIQDYISKIFFFFLDKKTTLLFLQKKGEIDVAAHENPAISNIITRVNEQGMYRTRNFVDRQYYLLQNIAETLIASAILLFYSWWVFLIIFILTIPELIVEGRYGRENWGIWTGSAEARRRFWNLQYHFTDLPKLTELKLFQNTSYFTSIIREILTTFQLKSIRQEQKRAIYKFISGIVAQLAIAFAIFWFVLEVVNGRLLIGTLVFVLASVANFRQSLAGLFMNLGKQYEDSFFVADFFKLIDLPPTIKKPERGIVLDVNKTPEIVFENVSWHSDPSSRTLGLFCF